MPSLVKRPMGERVFDTCNVVFMILFSVIMIYPFYYVLILSLNEGMDAGRGAMYLWPRKFSLDNYKFVMAIPDIKRAFVVTVVRSVIGPVFSLCLHLAAGYALSKRDIPGRKSILFFYLIPTFIGGSVVSQYVVNAKLGLINNFFVYIIPPAFNFFSMVIMRTFIEQIPPSVEESAKMDGAKYHTILVRIIAPLSKPIIAAILFFGVVYHWLDFQMNLLYITTRSLRVLQYVMYQIVRLSEVSSMMEAMVQSGDMASTPASQGKEINPDTIRMATLVFVTFPILFVYPFFQKYFVKGLMVGAIKA